MAPPSAAAADGETRTSRVVGSVGFVRPTVPVYGDGKDGEDQLVSITGVRHHMPFTIKCISAGGTITTKELEDISNEVFTIVDEKLNIYNPDSEINVVNALPGDSAHPMSRPLQEVVVCAKELVKLTRGAFDPSVAPLLKHYKRMAIQRAEALAANKDDDGGDDDEADAVDIATIRRQRGVIERWKGLANLGFTDDPTDSRVSKTVRRLMQISQWGVAFSVGKKCDQGKWKSFRISDHKASAIMHMNKTGAFGSETQKQYEIRKKVDDAEIDLNGIAKGWVCDNVAKRLANLASSNNSAPSCYVEWGGDVKVCGTSGVLYDGVVPLGGHLLR